MELYRKNEDRLIVSSNFGGLNSYVSPHAVSLTQSPDLLNVDVGADGKVRKRKGTRVIYEERTEDRVYVATFTTNLNFSFLIAKQKYDLHVLEVVNDEAVKIWSKTNVFHSSGKSSFVILPAFTTRILVLEKYSTPIQVVVHEKRVGNVTGTSVVSTNSEPFNADALVYVNGVRTTATLTRSGSSLQIVFGTSLTNAVVDIVQFSYQWVAEAVTWYGENFLRSTSRYGASLSDQHVQVPPTIISDKGTDYYTDLSGNQLYPIEVYSKNSFNQKYSHLINQQPRQVDEFSFSDGTDYNYEPNKYVNRSPFFVTFGKPANANSTVITDEDIDYTTSTFNIPSHGFSDYDGIYFNSSTGTVPIGITPGTEVYVKKLSNDSFEIYSNITLTTKITLSTRAFVVFTDLACDYVKNRFTVTGHGFTNGDAVKYSFSDLPVGGLSQTVTYYTKVIDANQFELHLNRELTQIADISPRTERAVTSTDVDTVNDVITVASHLFFDRRGIRFRAGAGTLPTSITAFQLYYVRVITNNIFDVFSNQNLTTKITGLTGSAGTFFVFEDGGEHRLTVYSDDVTVERQNIYESVHFSRRRQLPFNNNTGILPSNLQVFVNGFLADRHTSVVTPHNMTSVAYYLYDKNMQLITNDSLAFFISFEANSIFPLKRPDRVEIVNTQVKFVGTSCTNKRYYEDALQAEYNGTYYPYYGYGYFADYLNGYFPSIGVVFQGRLCLSGFPQQDLTVVLSSVSDSQFENEFFTFFQITDDLTTPPTDPFDIVVSAKPSDYITALLNYQQNLFIFTEEAVFRTFANDPISVENRVVGLVGNQGAVNADCVVSTESTIIYMSYQGVYDLDVITENQFRAAEVSVQIRGEFKSLKNKEYRVLPWMVFDKVNQKVVCCLPEFEYLESPKKILVFDTFTGAWTVWQAYDKFKCYSGFSYRDSILGELVGASVRTKCDLVLLRFNYDKLGDYIRKKTNLESPIDAIETPVWYTTMLDGVRIYHHDLVTVPIVDVEDLVVRVGASLTELYNLEFNVTWKKLRNGAIQLLFDPIQDWYLVVEPKIEDGSALVLWKNNIPEPYDISNFKGRFYDDICTIPEQGGEGGSGGTPGWVPPFIETPSAPSVSSFIPGRAHWLFVMVYKEGAWTTEYAYTYITVELVIDSVAIGVSRTETGSLGLPIEFPTWYYYLYTVGSNQVFSSCFDINRNTPSITSELPPIIRYLPI